MQLEIRSRGVPITHGLRKHIERRLGFALKRFVGDIRRVWVQLADMNGPRGGVDKRCRVELLFQRRSRFVLEDSASTLRGSIDRVSDKVGSYVAKRLQRRSRQRLSRDSIRFHPESFLSGADGV